MILRTQHPITDTFAAWRDEARRVSREEDHGDDVIVSMFDRTGRWSEPWFEAGYDVRTYDIENGDDLIEFFPIQDVMAMSQVGKRVVGVLAAPPCTSFASAGARWWKDQHDKRDSGAVESKYGWRASRYFERPLDVAITLVRVVEALVEFAAPSWWAMENPVGRMASKCDMGPARLWFNPCDYGDPWTKRTGLWGEFNADLPRDPVEPTEGSRVHRLTSSDKRRSATPLGFAYAFFMANRGVG